MNTSSVTAGDLKRIGIRTAASVIFSEDSLKTLCNIPDASIDSLVAQLQRITRHVSIQACTIQPSASLASADIFLTNSSKRVVGCI